jgi:hypothetical protein
LCTSGCVRCPPAAHRYPSEADAAQNYQLCTQFKAESSRWVLVMGSRLQDISFNPAESGVLVKVPAPCLHS